jgi:hypothetical protein
MINYDSFNNNLKNIKYKHLLIFKFLNLMEFLDDDNASKILSLLINNYLDIFIKYSFYEISKYIPIKRYTKTLTVLVTFYELMKEKTKLIISLSKWNLAYKNKIYWMKDNKYQIEHLLNLKLIVKSLFDCAFGEQLFGIKIIPIVKANINNSKKLIFENVIESLTKLYKLLGHNFFKIANIQTMIINDFFYLKDNDKINYIVLVQIKTLNLIDETIENYEKLNMVNLKIDNLLNPFLIYIENDTFSEYDIENINNFL